MYIEMSKNIKKAYLFAYKMHHTQKRKFSGKPYIYHPECVATLVASYVDDENMIIAALLHDVVEDTVATILDIEKLFGNDVAALVNELTLDKFEKEAIGKKQLLVKNINNMSTRGRIIKFADRLCNVTSLLHSEVPKDFKKWYVKETRYIFDNIDMIMSDVEKEIYNTTLFIIRFIEANEL